MKDEPNIELRCSRIFHFLLKFWMKKCERPVWRDSASPDRTSVSQDWTSCSDETPCVSPYYHISMLFAKKTLFFPSFSRLVDRFFACSETPSSAGKGENALARVPEQHLPFLHNASPVSLGTGLGSALALAGGTLPPISRVLFSAVDGQESMEGHHQVPCTILLFLFQVALWSLLALVECLWLVERRPYHGTCFLQMMVLLSGLRYRSLLQLQVVRSLRHL